MHDPQPIPSLLQRFHNASYRSPGPRLPGGTEVVDPASRFIFFAPWPWYEVPVTELMGSNSLGAPADLVVVAPRTDGREPLFSLTVIDEELVLDTVNPRRLAKQLLRGSQMRITDTERVVIGGRRALLIHAIDARPQGWETSFLVAPFDHGWVQGRADLPHGHAVGYRSHVRSMLASWEWAR